MQRIVLPLLCLTLAWGLVGCGPKPEDTDPFDDAFLVGHWVEQTVHEKYLDNGLGTTWDIADDVMEQEADTFSWYRDKNQLIQEHQMVVGVVPRILTIEKLDADSLVYYDTGGKTHHFHRCDSIHEENH